MATHTSDKSLSSLIADLTRETTTLVRDEVQLAKSEMTEKMDQATGAAVKVISGALVAFAGLLALLYAATVLLAELISPWTTEPWVAPLIVGIIVAGVGLIMLQSGRNRLKGKALAPRRTVDSFRRDKQILRG